MSVRMVLRGRRALLLAVVVTGLLAALVAMHHLAVAPAGDATVAAPIRTSDPGMPHDDPSHDGGGHDSLLHLCLAVVVGVATLVAAAMLWPRSRPIAATRRVVGSALRSAPRAPPPTAPARLALLCVLRT